MIEEARLVQTDSGLVPQGDGWFVANAREARWSHSDTFGSSCSFEGTVRFPDFGINVQILSPAQPNCLYHGESAQENFLVLAGACLLLVEGQERLLKQWDFVHCPPWTEHVFVGTGTGPCAILMVGTRPRAKALRYPVVDVARKHNASVLKETSSGTEAYAPLGARTSGQYRAGTLPDIGSEQR
jgi:uncharacterized cupin superfamily protein